MSVEHEGEPLLVCPYRQKSCGRLTAVEPQEACPRFRERVRPAEEPGEGTCLIPLVNWDGLCALVDAADYEWLRRYTWRAVCANGRTFYACTYCEGKLCLMHRMIMNPPAGMVVDHKNRYGLDNHRVNLRHATPGQNNINRAWDTGASGFRGVYPCRDKWGARIGHQRRTLYIGLFDDPAEAARAYDRKAIELHGEFACLNFPEEAGRRIVCLSGTARVCPAVVARVRRMLCASSQGSSVPLPFVEVIRIRKSPCASDFVASASCRCCMAWKGTPNAESCPAPEGRSAPRGDPKPLPQADRAHESNRIRMIPLGPSASRPWDPPTRNYALGTPCCCYPERAGWRGPGIPVAWRRVPLWARGPPWRT